MTLEYGMLGLFFIIFCLVTMDKVIRSSKVWVGQVEIGLGLDHARQNSS